MPSGNVLHFTQGFSPDAIGEIPLDDAVARVGAFCSDPGSGFLAYDLVGYVARKSGRLEEISPWTILVADALAGRISVADVNEFARHIEEFAKRLGDVPEEDLAGTDEDGLGRVIEFCCFGFRGAWAPKITKVGALFRNEAIPILDGHLARAFGYPRNGFTAGRESRRAAITKVVSALRAGISTQKEELATVRDRVAVNAPAVTVLSDVRLTDLILWTSQDDRDFLSRGRVPWWTRPTRTPPLTVDLARWIPLGNPPRPATRTPGDQLAGSEVCMVNGVPYTPYEIRKLKAGLPESNRSAQALHAIGAERPGQKYGLWDIADRLGIQERSRRSQSRIAIELARYSQWLQHHFAKPVVTLRGTKGVKGVAWPIELDLSSGTVTYMMPRQIAEWWLAS